MTVPYLLSNCCAFHKLEKKKEKNVSRQETIFCGCSSGWKKDWDGKWIRDEEAEFDSDEEAPDLP